MVSTNFDGEYDPISVEAAIDDAYTQAEKLGEYQESVEDAIQKIETLPYAIHGGEDYGKKELVETFEGLAQLGEVSHRPTMDSTGDVIELMDVISGNSGEMTLEDHLEMGEELEETDALDRMDQAAEYSQIIDAIGQKVVEEVYEPLVEASVEEKDRNYEDVGPEEMVENLAEQAEVEEETIEAAAQSVAQFKGELLPDRGEAI